MAWNKTCSSLVLLVVILGTSAKYSSPPASYSSTQNSSCFFRQIDYHTKCVQYLVTIKPNALVLCSSRQENKKTLLYLSMLLLTNSSDVELNPGPRTLKYPCQVCEKAVTWRQRGIACDDCEQWYHAQCLHMSTLMYETLGEHSNLSFHCHKCGMPNFASSLFDSYIDDSSSDTNISALNSSVSSASSPGPPISASSPFKTTKKQITPSYRNLKVLNVNFQSCKNKTEEIGNLCDSAQPHIIIGTETWLNPTIYSYEIFPSNYDIIRKDRGDGYGGVLLAIRNDIIYEKLDTQGNSEIILAKITLDRNKSLIVGSAYRPPSSDTQYMEGLCSIIKEVRNKYKNAVTWIGGDLNLPDINWQTNTIDGNQYTKRINSVFLDLVESCSMHQVVSKPTRYNSVIDIFLTNRPTLITRCTTLPGLGDHDIVFIESSASAKRAKPVKRLIHLWNKADLELTKSKGLELKSSFLSRFTSFSDVNSMWDFIKQHLQDILNTCVPSKMTTERFNQPWINKDVKQLSRRKKRAYVKARKTRNSRDINRYKKLKRQQSKTCRTAHNNYVNDMINPDSKVNPKRLYSYLKSKKNDNSGVAPLKSNSGITHSDSASKANILNDQFSSVFNKGEDPADIPDMGPSPHASVPHINVTEKGINKLLKDLKPHKAKGPDNIPGRLLKELADEISPVYRLLFQASLDQGVIPDDWKKADVVPIYKKGDRNRAENYRPVSLTSITCKTLEHIVYSSIMRHLDKHTILTDAQHGFRKRRSCETQLLSTIQDLASTIDTMGQTDVILLDFSKAFDKVPHLRLASKIAFYGVRGSLNNWVRSFLSGRTQQVLLEGCSSSQAPVESGVPQGSVLGPLLFLMYINDLPEYVTNGSSAKLFADDSALYHRIRTEDDAHALQKDLDGLQKWESDWLMEFHPQKCQVLHVTNKRKPITMPYTIHGHTLEEVDSAKYLGLNIHRTLSWNNHINLIAKKANNTRSFLERNLNQCPQKTKQLCFTTLVRPIIEYASVIWDPFTEANIRKLEMVQRRSARMVFSDHRRTSSVSAMLQQLQWPTLQERRAQAKVTMMYRIVHQLVEVPTNHLIPTTSIRGHGQSFLIPFARTQCFQRSFFPDTIRLWNGLPQTVVSCSTLDSFKMEVQSISLR